MVRSTNYKQKGEVLEPRLLFIPNSADVSGRVVGEGGAETVLFFQAAPLLA